MLDSILVTYATRYGSTREVAEQIAATLREAGLKVDVHPVREVPKLAGYRAVVLGAPLYIGSWLKPAQKFLEQNQEALARLPVAIFSLGPTRAEDLDDPEVGAQLGQQLAKYPWLKPVAAELFGGKYDPAGLRFLDGLLAKLPASPLYQLPASDARDWDAIRAWAGGLAATLSQPNQA